MTFLKRIVALIVLLLSVAGIIGCIAGIVGIWKVRPPVEERTNHAFARIDTAVNDAERTLQEVGGLLERASQNLKEIKDAAPPPKVSLPEKARQDLAVKVVDQVTGVNNIRPKIQTLIEVTAVANSILGDLQDLPAGTLPFERDKMKAIDDHVSMVSDATQNLANIFGVSGAVGDADANSIISRIDDALQRITALIQEYQTKVEEVRSRVREIKTQVDTGLRWGPAVATGLLAWFTIAQISLSVHACSWLRSRKEPAA